uniref:F-box domain-containing protein n=3 Tax=Aegilops tauschii subsp. strangulata TaxID=200361 RepID=A0A453MTL5_AEGTS
PSQAMEKPVEEPFSRLTDDLIAEILSRVPYKSLRICECVCPAWRAVVTDPASRRRIAQTLAGFFHIVTDDEAPGFAVSYADLSAFPWASVPKAYPRLPVPPDRTDCFFYPEDSSDGLFLTRVAPPLACVRRDEKFLYMVSNPATGDYFVLPHSGYTGGHRRAYLGFDGDAPTQEFHVFEFVLEKIQALRPTVVRRVNIYSSETGAWVARESQWNGGFTLRCRQPGVFRKGCLHLLTDQSALAIVDAQGLKWRTVPLPTFVDPSIQIFIVLAGPALLHIRRMLTEFRNTCQRPPLFLKVQVALAVKSVCASITPVPPFSFFV